MAYRCRVACSERSRPEIFGKLQQGSEAPNHLIKLLGFPIARACTPRVSHDWIHVTKTIEGFDISVDTTSTGTLRGSLDLKGPTGTAVIAIDVELLSKEVQTSQASHAGRPAYVEASAPAVPAGKPKGGSATEGGPAARQTAKSEVAEHSSPDAAKAADLQAVAPGRVTNPATDESAVVPQSTEVPAMPNIRPSEQTSDAPYPLLDGPSPTIGWQFRPQKKGGPAYMIIRRSAFGMFKAVETFPLTEEGWASAWQALLKRNATAVPQVLAALKARDASTATPNLPRGLPFREESNDHELPRR
jgi:hypothetical protein